MIAGIKCNGYCCCSVAIILAFVLYLMAYELYHSPSLRIENSNGHHHLFSRFNSKSVGPSSVSRFKTLYPRSTCPKHAVICHRQKSRESNSFLEKLSIHSLKFLFHSILTDLDFTCSKRKLFGELGLGVYDVCMVPGVQPKPNDCLVYSFGVSDDWTFDEAMAEFGCEVHSFDPSIGMEDHRHSPNVSFHNVGLWGSNIVNAKGWKLERLSTIRRNLGHEKRVIDILKIDIEGGEWPFLRDVLYKNSTQLTTVGQILTELHAPRFKNETVVENDYIEMISYVMDVKDLGFRIFKNFHDSNCCRVFAGFMPPEIPERCCEEIGLVNTRFL